MNRVPARHEPPADPCRQSHLSLVTGAAVGASQPPGRLEKALVLVLVVGVAWGLVLGASYGLWLLLTLP